MKLPFTIGLIFIAFAVTACSLQEEQQAAQNHPSLAAATQATEHLQQKIDAAADKAQVAVDKAKAIADSAAVIGIPYASVLAVILGIAGTILGKYHEKRNGTIPLMTAVTQVVQSIEQAFPTKTPEQKSKLAEFQDEATKKLVDDIKKPQVAS